MFLTKTRSDIVSLSSTFIQERLTFLLFKFDLSWGIEEQDDLLCSEPDAVFLDAPLQHLTISLDNILDVIKLDSAGVKCSIREAEQLIITDIFLPIFTTK